VAEDRLGGVPGDGLFAAGELLLDSGPELVLGGFVVEAPGHVLASGLGVAGNRPEPLQSVAVSGVQGFADHLRGLLDKLWGSLQSVK